MSDRREDRWVREALHGMEWPELSPGLRDRVMAAVSGPELLPPVLPGIFPARMAMRLSLGMLSAFVIAFALGMMLERPALPSYADIYASPLYYGEIDSRFDRPQEF